MCIKLIEGMLSDITYRIAILCNMKSIFVMILFIVSVITIFKIILYLEVRLVLNIKNLQLTLMKRKHINCMYSVVRMSFNLYVCMYE